MSIGINDKAKASHTKLSRGARLPAPVRSALKFRLPGSNEKRMKAPMTNHARATLDELRTFQAKMMAAAISERCRRP